jgi:hypothetical protein
MERFMKSLKVYAGAGLCLALAALHVSAQEPTVVPAAHPLRGNNCPPPQIVLPDCPKFTPGTPSPGGPGQVPPVIPPDQGLQPPAAADTLGQAPEGGTLAAATRDPGLFGDLIGIQGHRVILLPRGVTAGSVPKGVQVLSGNRALVVAPLPARGAFKITENESPLPSNRVFFDYNYFNGVNHLFRDIPGTNADLHREMIGFEKTILDGNASIGMRLPFLQLTSGSGVLEDSHVGDLSLVFKYAFFHNRDTGNALSGGMVLTTPTGEELVVQNESSIHSTVFQPFVGWIYHLNRDFYFQGFTSLAAPTDIRDVTLLFNSVAAGYHLYRSEEADARLRGIIPVAELHINTPLNHRGLNSTPLGFDDSVNFTGGVYLQFRRATLGLSVCTPLTGPKPYDIEAQASLNFRF